MNLFQIHIPFFSPTRPINMPPAIFGIRKYKLFIFMYTKLGMRTCLTAVIR